MSHADGHPQPALASHLTPELRACWNERGVNGTRDCPELRQIGHCRNCAIYSRAGAQLLDRPLPEEYRRQWTEHLRERKKGSSQSNISVLVFRLGSAWFALPTRLFLEALEHRPIHSVPHRQQGLLVGLVNVRGEIWLCVSLSHLLQLADSPSLKRLRFSHRLLLAASWQGARFVFPVDQVLGTHRLGQEELKVMPPTPLRALQALQLGMFMCQERSVAFLDEQRLFGALERSLK